MQGIGASGEKLHGLRRLGAKRIRLTMGPRTPIVSQVSSRPVLLCFHSGRRGKASFRGGWFMVKSVAGHGGGVNPGLAIFGRQNR